MTFTNPAVLYGLIAVLIPLILHLIFRRRVKKVDFSNLVFLRQIQNESRFRHSWLEWLITILRMLLIGALVLAFARPVSEQQWLMSEPAKTTHIIIPQMSPEWSLRIGDETAKDRLIRAVDSLTESFTIGDEIRLFDPQSEHLRSISADALRGVLVDFPEVFSDPQEVADINRIIATSDIDSLNRRVHVFRAANLPVPALADRIHTVIGRADSIQNYGIVQVALQNLSIDPTQPVFMTVQALAPRSVDVELRISVDQKIRFESVARGNIDTLINLGRFDRGRHIGEVELDVSDAYRADNRSDFTFDVRAARRILVRSATDPLSALFKNFPDASVRFTITNRLNRHRLDQFDQIIYEADAGSSSDAVLLKRYLDGNGSVILFPHPAAKLSSLISGKRWRSSRDGSRQVISWQPYLRTEFPLLDAIRGRRDGIRSQHVLTGASEIVRPMLGVDRQPLLEFDPEGPVFRWTVPVSPELSNLSVHPSFIPVMRTLIDYQPERIRVDSNRQILLLTTEPANQLRLSGPSDMVLSAQHDQRFAIPASAPDGIYQVTAEVFTGQISLNTPFFDGRRLAQRANVQVIRSTDQATRYFAHRFFLALALLLGMIELYLGRRFAL